MEFVIGFFIAFAIAVTGVGAGTITAPLLILFLHIPIAISVGTALAYSAIVKLIVVPVQIWRRQVDYRIVGIMLLGGLPGVILGVLLFHHAVKHGQQSILYIALGSIIIASSVWTLYKHFRPEGLDKAKKDYPTWIAVLMFPIGAEVGFSSSGAGALGMIALLSLTTLSASQIVGTDLTFGLCLSLVGGGLHVLGGSYAGALLLKLVVGGTLGALVGSGLAPKLPNRQLRLVMAVCLLMIGIQFCYQAIHSYSEAPSHSTHANRASEPIPGRAFRVEACQHSS